MQTKPSSHRNCTSLPPLAGALVVLAPPRLPWSGDPSGPRLISSFAE
ncbi:hypothetical protein ACP70R_040563 [Stipagrostis hirtigluma subsp. patula]